MRLADIEAITKSPTLPPGERSDYRGLSDAPAAFSAGSTVVWPTTMTISADLVLGALKGDDYPLTYDERGFPELPACLDRRKVRLSAKAA